MAHGASSVDEIWNIITVGDDVERRRLTLLLSGLDPHTRRYLAQRAIDMLDGECRSDPASGDVRRGTRGWLLSTLVRLAANDSALRETARTRAVEALDPSVEPFAWARYWALETLYQCGDPEVEQLARRALATAPSDEGGAARYVASLAKVIIAARSPGDPVAAEVRERISSADQDTAFYTRPLRTIFAPAFAAEMIKIVDQRHYCDAMFDALGYVGRIPPSHPAREDAAAALSKLIRQTRPHSFWDQARTAAIDALARVGGDDSVGALAMDLCDDNPAIVRAAAIAVADLRGADAVPYIVDQARRSVAARPVRRASILEQYAMALRCLRYYRRDDGVITQLAEMLSSGREEDRSVANDLLMNLGGAKAYEKLRDKERFIESLVRSDEKVQRQIEEVIGRAQKGLMLSRWLDIAIFALGAALVVTVTTAAVAHSKGDPAVLAGAAGAGGVLGILMSAWLVASRSRILDATAWLVHVHAAFMGYTRQLHQADQAFARRLGAGEPVKGEEMQLFARLVDGAMRRMLPRLSRPRRQPWFGDGETASKQQSSGEPSVEADEPIADQPADPNVPKAG